MQKLWGRVKAVGPDDRPSVVIDSCRSKVSEVTERLAERAADQERAVNVSDNSVVERDLKLMAVER